METKTQSNAISTVAAHIMANQIRKHLRQVVDDTCTDEQPLSWGYQVSKKGKICRAQLDIQPEDVFPTDLSDYIFLAVDCDFKLDINIIKERIDVWIKSTDIGRGISFDREVVRSGREC